MWEDRFEMLLHVPVQDTSQDTVQGTMLKLVFGLRWRCLPTKLMAFFTSRPKREYKTVAITTYLFRPFNSKLSFQLHLPQVTKKG